MAISISFPPFTNEQYMFLNKEAANAFFQSVTVPSATEDDEGVVKQAEEPTQEVTELEFDDNTYIVDFTYTTPDDEPATQQIPTRETIDAMITTINQLVAWKVEFELKQQAAGQMAGA